MAKAISSADSAPRLDPSPPTVTLNEPQNRGLVIGFLRPGATA